MGECINTGGRPNSVAGGWSEWSPWSDCSRTCGGGITRRQRRCDNPQPKNGGAPCPGIKVEHQLCNTKDCEPSSMRFRELQCKEHNNKPFKGEKFRWTPTSPPESDPNPCALYCVNEKHVLAKLELRVKDGTRCRPGSKDTCIHGICVKVGCDWKINSDVEEDICGDCGGDGTHCNITKEVYNETNRSGYVEITQIPVGSKNIAIKELGSGENTVAIGNSDGEIYLNGGYLEQPPGDYVLGGVRGTYTKPEENREEIHIKGPLKEEITLFTCFFQDENRGVQYYFVTPTDEPVRKAKYHWEFVDWGDCSVRCGGGIQVSKPVCTEEISGRVKDHYCANLPNKPQPQTRCCNSHNCRTRWKVWKWGPCSGCIYRTGKRVRPVECVMENPKFGDGDEIIVNSTECARPAPKSWELCNSLISCSVLEQQKLAKNLDEDLLEKGYYSYCYDLEGVEDSIFNEQNVSKKNPFYSNKLHGNFLHYNNHNPGTLIKDKIDMNKVVLKIAKLGPSRMDFNLTEEDFISSGDTIPNYIPENIKAFQGRQAAFLSSHLINGKGLISAFNQSSNLISINQSDIFILTTKQPFGSSQPWNNSWVMLKRKILNLTSNVIQTKKENKNVDQ